uniref:Uncharacterized protein n=1 Tax=Meloidogyne javanica TaxID=6303 RepID=A0A915NF54_MELJA
MPLLLLILLSPLRRSVAQQAVSPLASPMESRRVFMATHHQNNPSGGGGGGSPPPAQLSGGQIMGTAPHPAVGLSAVQLGYAIPACRLLVDPHTGQQFFVPTVTAPQPLATAAAPAFFQPIYTQQTAYFQQPPLANFSSNNSSNNRQRQHNNQVLSSPSSSPPNQHHQRHLPATVSQPQGPFFYNVGHPQHQLTSSSGPLSTSPRDDRLEDSSTAGLPYKVEMPPSTVGSIAYNDERRRPSNDTYEGYDVETEEEQIQHQNRGNYFTDRNFHQQQQQQFQRREQARLSTESRQSNSTRDSGRGGLMFGSPDNNNNNSDIEEPSPRYYSSYSPPPSHQYKQHQHYQNNQMSTSTIIGGGGGSSDSTSGFASMIGGCENKNYSSRGATVLRTAPPTAFTISFNDEHAQLGGQVSIAEVSLQEAARQAPKGRRLMLSRKNENFNKQNQQQPQDSGSECGGDPKRWLFRKMMMGRKGETAAKSGGDRRRRRSGSAISEATTSTTMSGGGNETTEEGQEDLASEAGTYVVENKIKTTGEATTINDVMTTSQISGVSNTSSNRTTQRCYDSDSDSSSSTHASTHTSSTGRTPSPGNPPISATTTTTNIRLPLTISGQVGKRSLMSDLRQLRESGQIEKPSIINQQSASNVKIANKKIPPKALGVLPTTTKLASTAPPIPPHRGNSAGVTATTTITTNSNQNNQKKNTTIFASNPIPFSRPCRCPTQHQQQQAFRRNDGGRFSMRPTSATRANTNALRQTASSNAAKLKAAEEEKMLGWLRRKEYDPQSHRSHDELNRLAEVCDDEDDSLGLTSDSCNTSLQRTVDELTQKCHKSIALLNGTFVVKKSRSGGVSLDVADDDTLKYQTKEKKKL